MVQLIGNPNVKIDGTLFTKKIQAAQINNPQLSLLTAMTAPNGSVSSSSVITSEINIPIGTSQLAINAPVTVNGITSYGNVVVQGTITGNFISTSSNFSGNNTSQIVNVTQAGSGDGLKSTSTTGNAIEAINNSTAGANGATIRVTNNGTDNAISASNTGDGNVIVSTSTFAGSSAVFASSTNTGAAVNASNTTLGNAIFATSAGADGTTTAAINATNTGAGNAITASVTGTGNVISTITTGAGAAIKASSTNTGADMNASNTTLGNAIFASNSSTTKETITAINLLGGSAALFENKLATATIDAPTLSLINNNLIGAGENGRLALNISNQLNDGTGMGRLDWNLVRVNGTILPNSFFFGLPSPNVADNFSITFITPPGILSGSLLYVNTVLTQAVLNGNIVVASMASTILGPFTQGVNGLTFPLNTVSGTATPAVAGIVTIFTGDGPLGNTIWTPAAVMAINTQSMFIFGGNSMTVGGNITFSMLASQDIDKSTAHSEIWVYNTNSGTLVLQNLTGTHDKLLLTPTTNDITINAGSFLTFVSEGTNKVRIKGYISTTNTVPANAGTLVITIV